MIPWQQIFSDPPNLADMAPDGSLALRSLADLKAFLDSVHIRNCLVKPYQEMENYPVVEARELLPSFENDMCEYKNLPGLSLVAFARPLDYFSEIFQFDKLHTPLAHHDLEACPLENRVYDENLRILSSRLPKSHQEKLRADFEGTDTTLPDNYSRLLPYLLEMDRAQVFALDSDRLFHLAGVFASFPSDIDSELKRFGIRIGKFVYGDSEMYERNRMFVYQYFMELYGFPVVSERRTSSALFARKLHKMGESFLLRVLGQSDRTLTTYISGDGNRRYPRLEKTALVRVEDDQEQALETIRHKGFFLDEDKNVVIMRIRYRQHRFDPANLRQDRALSVSSQEILHPLTGAPLPGLNIIKDASNMFLRLNDIVRGEYNGRVVYKRTEVVENTDTDEKRLKFLYSWLTKHQRRMISYSDDFYNNVIKVLSGYLYDTEKVDIFDSLRELYQEVCSTLSYIQQARRVRILQDLSVRGAPGPKIGYKKMCRDAVAQLNELKFDIVNFFPDLVDTVIHYGEIIIHDRYLQRAYINPPESSLTASGLEIRKNYGRIIALLDAIKAVRKARMSGIEGENSEASVA